MTAVSAVSTGFIDLDRMIAGNSDCLGFPIGGVSLLIGGTGSGKTQLLQASCERAYDRGLRVVWVEPGGGRPARYRKAQDINSIQDLARLMGNLLHPSNQVQRANLIVVDDLHVFSTEIDSPLAARARTLQSMFNGNLGPTAVVVSMQTRSGLTVRDNQIPASLDHQSRVTLKISKNGSAYELNLLKSVVSQSGVSCTVNPNDLSDRSKIPTRYERILRGRD
jgi:predicted AAA+ superfamily ATPase